MASSTRIYDKFEENSLCGCSVSECYCSEEKIKALMRESRLSHAEAGRFVAENRGVDSARVGLFDAVD
jgi:hypothetical protein